MPSSRRTPRRRERPRADMESAPTTDGKVRGKWEIAALRLSQTSVGDDACIVPRTLRHRKVPGRDKSRPYDQRKARTQPGNGNLVMPQTPVGDDACIVPGTLRRRKAPGGINPAPTIDGRPVPNRETATLPCRNPL